MKKIYPLLIISLLLHSLTTHAVQPIRTKEDTLWESLKNRYLNDAFQLTTYPGDIKIQLLGNITSGDSIYLEECISELSGLIKRVKIYRVKDHGNLVLNIQTLPDSVYDPPVYTINYKTNKINYKTKLSKVKVKPTQSQMNSQKIKTFLDSIKLENILTNKVSLNNGKYRLIWWYYIRQLNSNWETINTDVKSTRIHILIRHSAPQLMRNKAIQFYLIKYLIKSVVVKSMPVKPLVSFKNAGGFDWNDHSILGTDFDFGYLPNTQLQEKDRFILSKAYSKDFYLQLFIRYPKQFIKSLLNKYLFNRYGSYKLILYMALSILVGLLYILGLIKLNRIKPVSKSWLDYMKTGMLVMQSVTIIYLMYKLYEGKMIHGFFLAHLTEAIVVVNIFSFISLNFFYFFEKILIKKNTTILQRTYIQLFLSIIPLIYLFFTYYWDTLFMSFVAVYGFIMIFGRSAYTYFNFKTINAINEKDLEISHFREMQHRAELQALHSRINPHFLYNSLNSIAGLSRVNPEKTEKMALALSDFCRYTINKSNNTFGTVSEEADLANIYLEIEKIRFGEKLQYDCNVSDEVREMTIPRFIIQPLIENAIKHGITQLTGPGKIKLVIYKEEETLILNVFDNGPAFNNNPVKGCGLQSIYDKLEILYKGKAHMNWQNEPEKFISVVLPIEEMDSIYHSYQ